jgi:hypothetical protein
MQKLCRRIWWIIYVCTRTAFRPTRNDKLTACKSRESIHWILGIKNTRLQAEGDSTLLKPLAMDDWEDDDMVEEVAHILSPVQTVHKQYMIQLCRLCEIGKCLIHLSSV